MPTKTRSDLKSYFVKNAIPTEGNFADLIDSQLNQAQDGVFKPDNDALSVVASSGDQKRVLRLYASYPAANPDWMISLNPLQDPATAGSVGKLGFGITDGVGKTRLFIDAATGQIGVGTNTPQVALDVTGTVQATGFRANGALMIRRDVGGQLGPTLTLQNSSGGTGAGGAIDFNGYDPGTNNPSLRIQSLDDGNFSSHLTFSTKQPGSGTNTLAERLRLTNDGLLKFPNVAPKDKIVLWDGGTTDRFGIGLNASNINLFYPANARFSLRQNSSSGTEMFSVSSDGVTTLRRDVSGQLGPKLTLQNSSGGTGAGGAIDFNGNDPGSGNDPMLRIQSLDSGDWSSHLTFSTKQSGGSTNKLVERLRLTSDGVLQFPKESPKDKILLWNDSDRYGIGLNTSNINLFYPANARFSLRQNSSSGTEMFSVSGDGVTTIRRDVYGQVGPKLTLLNGGGDGGGGCAIDFNSYDPGTNDPALRIQTNDVGGWANFCKFMFKKNGAITNKLVERVRFEDNGQLTIYFDKGYWRFQYDGNLVKYRNDGTVLWALTNNPGW